MSTKAGQSSGSVFQQICVITDHIGFLKGRTGFSVYIIDVSSSPNLYNEIVPELNPVLQVVQEDVIDVQAFAFLGNVLYAFGGLDKDLIWRKEMRRYDLNHTYSSSTPVCLPISRMPKGPEMQGRKFQPKAVVIDKARICVFSLQLYSHDWRYYENIRYSRPNFELFDIRTDTWKNLPEPIDYASKCRGVAKIISYCTQGLSLIIYTNFGGFQIDFGNPNPKWKRFAELPKNYEPGVCIIEDNLLTPYSVAKLDEEIYWDDDLILLKGERELDIYKCNSGLFLKDGHVFILRTGFENLLDDVPKVFVHIIKYHDLISHVFKSEEIEPVKSFCFNLGCLSCQEITIVGCYWMKLHGRGRAGRGRARGGRRSRGGPRPLLRH